MKKNIFFLLAFLSICSKAYSQKFFDPSHKYIVGVEYGAYLYEQGGMGLDVDNASGAMYGANFGYILSNKVILNAGLQKVDFNYIGNMQFYKMPLSVSFTFVPRGTCREPEFDKFSDLFFYFLTFGFLPQTIELEGGLSLGVYDKSYTKRYTDYGDVIMMKPDAVVTEEMLNKYYDVTRKNNRVIPSIDLGFRWSFDFKHVHFTIHPKYSYLLVEDNIIEKESLGSHKRSRQSTRSAFGISGMLSYSF